MSDIRTNVESLIAKYRDNAVSPGVHDILEDLQSILDDSTDDNPEGWPDDYNFEVAPMTESQRQFARDFIYSDAPEEMKKELGIRPLQFIASHKEPIPDLSRIGDTILKDG